jgi:hypothetical protein
LVSAEICLGTKTYYLLSTERNVVGRKSVNFWVDLKADIQQESADASRADAVSFWVDLNDDVQQRPTDVSRADAVSFWVDLYAEVQQKPTDASRSDAGSSDSELETAAYDTGGELLHACFVVFNDAMF